MSSAISERRRPEFRKPIGPFFDGARLARLSAPLTSENGSFKSFELRAKLQPRGSCPALLFAKKLQIFALASRLILGRFPQQFVRWNKPLHGLVLRAVAGDAHLQQSWWGLSILVLLSSHGSAASAHRPFRAKALVTSASASSAFDRVPAAAERIAAAYGIVTSTYRTIAHNREVGGVADSYHLLGRAIDVARHHGITHAQIAAALRTAGYVLVESLDEGDHSHFAFALALPASSRREATVPIGPSLAADQHGALLADLNSEGKLHASSGPVLRIHIRRRR